MHKTASIILNEIQKILRDLEIQTDHQILARRPDLVLINKKKKTCHQVGSLVLAVHRLKIKES